MHLQVGPPSLVAVFPALARPGLNLLVPCGDWMPDIPYDDDWRRRILTELAPRTLRRDSNEAPATELNIYTCALRKFLGMEATKKLGDDFLSDCT